MSEKCQMTSTRATNDDKELWLSGSPPIFPLGKIRLCKKMTIIKRTRWTNLNLNGSPFFLSTLCPCTLPSFRPRTPPSTFWRSSCSPSRSRSPEPRVSPLHLYSNAPCFLPLVIFTAPTSLRCLPLAAWFMRRLYWNFCI